MITPSEPSMQRLYAMPWGAYKVYIESCCRNFKRGSFDWKLKLPFLIVESEWRVINPLLTPTISPKTFNQSLEIAILFNVVESSVNYVFKYDEPPRVPRAKVVSYALGAYKVFIDRAVVKLQKGAHSIRN